MTFLPKYALGNILRPSLLSSIHMCSTNKLESQKAFIYRPSVEQIYLQQNICSDVSIYISCEYWTQATAKFAEDANIGRFLFPVSY
jgi:hypothetical protein